MHLASTHPGLHHDPAWKMRQNGHMAAHPSGPSGAQTLGWTGTFYHDRWKTPRGAETMPKTASYEKQRDKEE